MLSVEVSSSKLRPESLKLRLPATSDNYLSFCEPCSPDSGFSSDDSITDSSFSDRISRAKTLPSALRRSRSKQNVKRVRFADSLGLDLENLQYFVNEELCQKFNHISFPQTSTSQSTSQNQQTPRLIVTNFAYRSEFEYNNLVRASNVCVSALRAAGNSIVGQVNLLNLAFDKNVTVRYTTDNWQTIDEVVAKYSHRMFATEDIDAFNFTIVLPAKLLSGSGKCEFCVSYEVAGNSYWDNNNGANYCIDVSIAPPRHFISSPTISTKSISRSSITSTLPSIPCTRSNLRKQQRRWGKSLDESDEEIYVPKNFSLKMKM